MSVTETARPPSAPRRRRGSAGVVAMVTIVLGVVVALAGMGRAVGATLLPASVDTGAQRVAVDGVTELDANVGVGSLRVEFGSVDQAVLTVTGRAGSAPWALRRDGASLQLRSPREGWAWWWNGWFGGARPGDGDAVLRLPRSLSGLDATMSLSAGKLTAEGRYGRLIVTAGAGRLAVDGSARSVQARVDAGQARLTLDGVRTGSLGVNAGRLDAALTGTPPDRLTVTANAGTMRVTVPAGDYDVTSRASVGSFVNTLGSTPGAPRTIGVDVSVGSVVLQPGP